MRSEFATLVCVAALAASARAATAEPTAASVTGVLPRSADWGLAHPSGRDTRFWVIAPPYDGLLRTATEVHLYDPTEKQFFRDAPFFDKKPPPAKRPLGAAATAGATAASRSCSNTFLPIPRRAASTKNVSAR